MSSVMSFAMAISLFVHWMMRSLLGLPITNSLDLWIKSAGEGTGEGANPNPNPTQAARVLLENGAKVANPNPNPTHRPSRRRGLVGRGRWRRLRPPPSPGHDRRPLRAVPNIGLHEREDRNREGGAAHRSPAIAHRGTPAQHVWAQKAEMAFGYAAASQKGATTAHQRARELGLGVGVESASACRGRRGAHPGRQSRGRGVRGARP